MRGKKNFIKIRSIFFKFPKFQICQFRFHTKAKLRRHMKSHTGERNYECNICQKKFLYSYNVVAHIRNVHEKKSKNSRIECSYCPESFWKAIDLNNHLMHVHHVIHEEEEIIEEQTLYEFVKDD